MNNNSKIKVTVIGAGRVGMALSNAITECNNMLLNAVIVRDTSKYNCISNRYVVKSFDDMPIDSDIYIVAVKDDSIREVSDILNNIGVEGIVVHTGGAVEMNVLNREIGNIGVLYPLRSFSLDETITLKDTPILIEASNEKSICVIRNVASYLSSCVYDIDSAMREKIHLAAVFANNFTNYMLTCSYDILSKEHVPFDVLKFLINDSISKILSSNISPKEFQSGPAMRKDLYTIDKHKAFLVHDNRLLELYNTITNSIIKYYGKF